MLQFLILILYVAGPKLQFRCDQLDGAWCGNQSFEVLKCGGLHLVVTEVVQPVGGSDDERVDFISVKLTSG